MVSTALHASRLLTLVLLGWTVGCTGVSLRYDTDDVPRVFDRALDLTIVDVIDARSGSGLPTRPIQSFATPLYLADDDWSDLNASVREHIAGSGWSNGGADYAASPTSAVEVDQLLAKAAAAGKDGVLFVRMNRGDAGGALSLPVAIVRLLAMVTAPLGGVGLGPLIVFESLPVNDELAYGEFQLLLVDPHTRQVIGDYRGSSQREDLHVTGWRHMPLRELPPILKDAMQAALEDAAGGIGESLPAKELDPTAVVERYATLFTIEATPTAQAE